MPTGWVPAGGAPTFVDIAKEIGGLVVGDPDAWSLAYLWIIDGFSAQYGMVDLCERFPLTVDPFNADDFAMAGIAVATAGPSAGISVLAGIFALRQKLIDHWLNRVGSHYCVNPGVTGGPLAYGWVQIGTGTAAGTAYTVNIDAPLAVPAHTRGFRMVTTITSNPTNTGIRFWTSNNATFLAPGFNGSNNYQYRIPAWSNNALQVVGATYDTTILNTDTDAHAPRTGTDGVAAYAVGDGVTNQNWPANSDYPEATVSPVWDLDGSANGGNPMHWAWTMYAYVGAASAGTNPPTKEPLPPGVLVDQPGVYSGIQEIGVELDKQEKKLDAIRDILIGLATGVVPRVPLQGPLLDASAGLVISGAVAIVIFVAGIPAGADEAFGTPAKYHRVGRVAFGSDIAWFPPIDLNETPLMLAVPQFATRVRTVVYPPATAQVSLLA